MATEEAARHSCQCMTKDECSVPYAVSILSRLVVLLGPGMTDQHFPLFFRELGLKASGSASHLLGYVTLCIESQFCGAKYVGGIETTILFSYHWRFAAGLLDLSQSKSS
jgi:hypothetical protein